METFSLAAFYTAARTDFTEKFISEWSLNEPNLRSYFNRFNIKCNTSTKVVAPDISLTLYNVKYDSLCKFEEPWQFACRGTTIGFLNGENVMFSVGLPKFFNDMEIPRYMPSHTIFTHMESLEKEGYSLVMVNKEDGSNIRFWYDQFGYLHAYTLGTTTEKEMQGNLKDSPTFTALAIKLLTHFYPKLVDYLREHPNVILVAELKSIWNKIVTNYIYEPGMHGSITPLVLIHPTYPEFRMSWKEIADIYPELYMNNGNPTHSLNTSCSTYLVDKNRMFAYQSDHPELFGRNPEGNVLYAVNHDKTMCFPVAKAKRPEYVEAHHHISLNVGSSNDFKSAQLLKLLGTYDDITGQIGGELRDEHIKIMEQALQTMVRFLDSIRDALIANKDTPKIYAELISVDMVESVWVGWLTPYLFKNRKIMNSQFDSLEFIIECLTTIRTSEMPITYDIQLLQNKYGVFWWEKSTHTKPKKLLVEPKYELEPPGESITKHPEIAIFDFDETLYNSKMKLPNTQIVNMAQLYVQLNIPVIILTGRTEDEADFVRTTLSSFCVSFTELYCRPLHKTVSVHKVSMMKRFSTEYQKIYHFEDNTHTISQCSQSVYSNHSQYAGHTIIDGLISNITYKNDCVFVGIVGPPGSGKTTVFNLLAERFENVSWISPDKIATQYRTEHGKKITPEEMHPALIKAHKHALEKGGIIFVDMCHNKGDSIKDIMTCGHPFVLCTFMNFITIMRKGKPVQVLTDEYKAFFTKNVSDRIRMKQMNGSTLDCENAVDIATKKAEGCLHQIVQRSIPVFGTTLLSPEEMATIVYKEITDILQSSSTTVAYMTEGIYMDRLDIQKLGTYVTRF